MSWERHDDPLPVFLILVLLLHQSHGNPPVPARHLGRKEEN